MARYTKQELALHALEMIHQSEDFAYFVDTYCMMWEKDGGDPIPFKLYDFQRDACHKFQNERQVIVLKARQMGMSWLAMAFVVWCILNKSNFHVYITSIGLKEVNEQMNRIRFIWYNLPEWMVDKVVLGGKGCKDNDSLIEFTNGSAIHAISSSKSGGHGAAPGLYILDEFSRKENDVMSWRAIKPSLGKTTKTIIISTSNGFNNVYADLWFGAQKHENDFVPIFYSALDHPEYTQEYLDDMRNDFAGDLQGYKEAFPLTADEAFMSSSRAIFDQDVIAYWLKQIAENPEIPQMRVGRIDDESPSEQELTENPDSQMRRHFVDDEAGHLMLWKLPVNGHQYTIGVDTAEGLAHGDFSVAVVYDATECEVVAMLRGKFSQEVFAYPIEQLGWFYNMAWIVVEVNKGSEIIMQDLKANYQWLYCRMVRANIADLPTRVPGFYTSSTSKPRIIMQLRRKLADAQQPIKLYSRILLKELAVYEENEKKVLGAPRGKHDDCVMSLALAIEGTTSLPYQDNDTSGWGDFKETRTWRSL